MLEAEAIRRMFTSNNDAKNIADIPKKFGKLMGKGNINGALKLLINNVTNVILPLDEKTFNCLKQKHSQSQPAYEETFINGESPVIHSIIYDDIN